MEHKVTFGNGLVGILHAPEKNKKNTSIIFSHGFLANKDLPLFVTIANALKTEGYSCLRFDHTGVCGESAGTEQEMSTTTFIQDLHHAVDYMHQQWKKIIVIGHSLGGFVAIIEASSNPHINGLILLAPPANINVQNLISPLVVQDWKKNQKYTFRNITLPLSFYEDNIRYNALEFIPSIKVPVYLLQGDADPVVHRESAVALINACKAPKKLEFVPHADHLFSYSEEIITRKIIQWLQEVT